MNFLKIIFLFSQRFEREGDCRRGLTLPLTTLLSMAYLEICHGEGSDNFLNTKLWGDFPPHFQLFCIK